jgi:uncharacterized OsmC-like protein
VDRSAEIRAAQERTAEVFRRKPSAALSTAVCTAHVEDGLGCVFRQGHRELLLDMPEVLGGTGLAPTPGFFFRAAVAGCVALGVRITAAREGLQVSAVDVGLDMDFDDSAVMAMGENSAAPLDTRVTITVTSQEPPDRIEPMIARALASDPFFLALRDAQKVSTTILRPEA